jgi:hypothetical protein
MPPAPPGSTPTHPYNYGDRTNLVASGLPLVPTVRYTDSFGDTYELFYDVYLPAAPNNERLPYSPYVFQFVYWSSKIDKRYPNRSVGDKKLQTPSAVLPLWSIKYLDSWAPKFTSEAVSLANYNSGTSLRPGDNKSVGKLLWESSATANLRPTGFSMMPDLSKGAADTPVEVGWKPTGPAPLYTPFQGRGGAPYWDELIALPPSSSSGSGNSGASGGSSSTDGTYIGSTFDGDITEEPADVGFSPPKKRKLRTNPPLISTATGAYVGVSVDGAFDPTEPTSRNDILGSGTDWQRRMRKGLIRQYIVNENEWKITGGTGSVTTQYDKKGKPKKTDSWDADASVLDPKIEYGFRFHYNPSEIGFGTMPVEGLDPALLLSGKDKAYPVAAEGASVSFNLYLNRIEDMSLLKKTGSNTVKSWRSLYAGRELPQEDLQGILKRGTGYDLEFLFRTALGRPWVTQLRGATADLGVVVGLPMMLNLRGGMRYTGRLTGLQYTHNAFTQDMVPMFTTVSITFTRMPDSVQYSQSGNG